jgi:hypothetical protein
VRSPIDQDDFIFWRELLAKAMRGGQAAKPAAQDQDSFHRVIVSACDFDSKIAAMSTDAEVGIYCLHIGLRDSRPSIWRRVLVPGKWTLGALHYVIQVAMGWTNSHLHQFIVGDDYISLYPVEGVTSKNSARVALAEIALKPKTKFVYEYDFGDSWEHDIIVEAIVQPKARVRYPTCVAGKRACPPDDCGGVYGYENLLAIIRDPDHEEHEDMTAWLEEMRPDFDPEAFDIHEVNRRLAMIRPNVLDAEHNVRLFV